MVESAPYLAVVPWDVERWQNSRSFRLMSLAAQGAYRNLCDAAWKAQPSCTIANDQRELWRLAGARSPEEWQAVQADVFQSDAWVLTERGELLNEVVLETYEDSLARHSKAVRAGRIAGKASARARRAMSQAAKKSGVRTIVERPLLNRSTIVNPPSPSPSPSTDTSGSETLLSSATALDGIPPRSLVVQVFEHWQRVLEHPGAKLTADRKRKIEGRLREGYTVAQLRRAIDGCRASAWHMGENEDGKRYDAVDLIFRNGGKVDEFIAMVEASTAPGAPRVLSPEQKATKDRVDAKLASLGTLVAGERKERLLAAAREAYMAKTDPVEAIDRVAKILVEEINSGRP
jgi:uncharacterized protein YdaU (DUF1376 family)